MFKEQLVNKTRLMTGIFNQEILDELMGTAFAMKSATIEEIGKSQIFPLGGYVLMNSGWKIDVLKLPDNDYLFIERQEDYELISGLLTEYQEQMAEYKDFLEEQRQLVESEEEESDKSLDVLEADSTKHTTLESLEEDFTEHLTIDQLNELEEE
ncbi:hypothetical protein JKP31_16130 [Vibrio vulnificus]|uniref:hypothetical protein n=1 Tax=Vibrio vulnificus TaxID=672 RepID=UPI001CDC9F4C|nr:hypothetical protein [Vibrio vulnificus]MCA3902826.1 hypothetical protein [Vibrio vulnificus]